MKSKQNRNKQTIVFGAVLILAILSVCGCSAPEEKEPEKKYVSTFNNQHFLILYPDGTFLIDQGYKKSFAGTWNIANGKLYLHTAWGSFPTTISKDGKTLTDVDGEVWKQTPK